MTTLRFGALAPPLDEQLEGSGIDPRTVAHFQRDHDAITRLAVRGLLSEREKDAAQCRLARRISKESGGGS